MSITSICHIPCRQHFSGQTSQTTNMDRIIIKFEFVSGSIAVENYEKAVFGIA